MKIVLIVSSILILVFRIIELGSMISDQKIENKIKIKFSFIFLFVIIWQIYLLTTNYYILGIFLLFKQSIFVVLEINMKSIYDKEKLKIIRNLLSIFDIIIPSVILADLFNRFLF